MPKELLLVRHAKSDWNDPKLPDFKRPLNSRGHRNAPEMANRLLKKGLIPQQIVSSPALRAITTAKYFAEVLGIEKNSIIQEENIYEASSPDLLKIVSTFDDSLDFTALFGHNPGITSLVNDFTGKDLYNVATCGVVLIRFPFDSWKMLSSHTGELIFYDYPKNEQD